MRKLKKAQMATVEAEVVGAAAASADPAANTDTPLRGRLHRDVIAFLARLVAEADRKSE